MTIPYSDQVRALAHEILMEAGKPYTAEQLKEIPRILNAKARYFWGNDLNDYEVLRDVFTAEGFKTFWSGQPGAVDIEAQVASIQFTIGQGDMVPMHFGHNQIVRFLDDTHAQLLTRMNDYHTYTDNDENYSGFGMYVDDLRKCEDGVWRIETLRLDYGVMLGSLRCYRQQQETD